MKNQKLQITLLAAVKAICFFAIACSTPEVGVYYFTIRMVGAYEEATPSEGTEDLFEPISQTYELRSVVVTGTANGTSEDHVLFGEDGVAESYRITNRLQKIVEYKMEDPFFDMEITNIKVAFTNQISGVSKLKSDHTVLLDATKEATDVFEINYAEPLTTNAGQGVAVEIKVKWKKTVTRDSANDTDTMVAPGLGITAEKS